MLRRQLCRFRRHQLVMPAGSPRTKIFVHRPATVLARAKNPVLLMALALSLAGCGASLNDGLTTDLNSSEQKAGAHPIENANAEVLNPDRRLSQAADSFTAGATPGNSSYKIGPQDVLDISVFKVPDLSRSVQVADSGTINLPLVGEIQAAGLTPQDLERELTRKYGDKYLQSPQVTVYVKEFNSRRVTIDGSVKKPGVYPIRGKTTLVQFIAMAEGPTDIADTSSIVVFRRTNGKRSIAKFDLSDIRSGDVADPVIEAGDVIVVNDSMTKSAFQNVLKVIPLATLVPLL
jgi:polysaccharide biosynthesis/export protein